MNTNKTITKLNSQSPINVFLENFDFDFLNQNDEIFTNSHMVVADKISIGYDIFLSLFFTNQFWSIHFAPWAGLKIYILTNAIIL